MGKTSLRSFVALAAFFLFVPALAPSARATLIAQELFVVGTNSRLRFPRVGRKLPKLFSLASILLLMAGPAWAGLPQGWNDADIGSPGLAGSAGYTNGNWTVTGGGSDIWNAADQFNFASTTNNGDGAIIAEVSSLQNSDPGSGWSKAGIMFRNDSSAGSANASIVATWSHGVSFQWRSTAGGNSSFTAVGGINPPVWLKLARSNTNFAGSYSTDGSNWVQVSSQSVSMNSSVLAGLDVTAHNNAALDTATFTNVSVTTTVVTNPVVVNQPASPVLGTSVTLNGQVVSTGYQTPAVTVYYGPTDGGTNAAAWSNSIALGAQSGSFSTTVAGLTPSKTYYFTASATNSGGLSWATPSLSFTMLSILLPGVTNAPPINVQSTSATLTGQVLSTGNQVPMVTVYYGTANGGSNTAAWATNVVLGPQSGAFAAPVAGLMAGTAYYYAASASNSAGVAWAAPSQSFSTLAAPTYLPINTYHYDNTRQGANTNEVLLTPANVNTNSFGKLFTYNVDGYAYAQALVATNVAIPGKGVHNILFVVTTHDTVYAFDADNYVPTPYWTNSFINPASGITAAPSADTSISPGSETGITATPVIDPASGTIYIEARTKEVTGGVTNYPHRLHALDIATGQEKSAYNSPVLITSTNYPGTGTPGQNDTDGNGHVLWNGLREHCRPALLLANGMVYVTYASPGDHPPYYGWIFSYDAHTLAQTGVFNSAPNSGYSGVWMDGDGPLADTNGYIYLNTGNGTFQTNISAYGDSILKLNGTNGLRMADYFAPYNTAALASGDWDVSSAGMCLLPSVNGTNLLLSGSKLGELYVLNRDNLGGWTSTTGNPNIIQSLPGAISVLWGSPAYWNGMIYIQPCGGQFSGSDTLKSFALNGLTINPVPTAHAPTAFGYPGGTPTVSANSTVNGIVWVIETDGYNSGGQAILHAYNATNISQELYNSSQLSSRDSPGVAVLYSMPIVANGKVYVGSQYGMSIYGNNVFLASPTISPAGEVFNSSVQITLADATPGTTLYYTLDGSIPTTNSILYTGPFTLTNSGSVNVVATKPGSVNSSVATAGFINSSAVGSGAGLVGSYYSNHTAASPYTGSPTLVRTDAVINFNWDTVAPDPSVGRTNFTVKWIGSVQPQFNETYTFYATADDGVRFFINGQELVNEWKDEAQTTYTASMGMVAQQLYSVEMDYYQDGGGAIAELAWSSPSTPEAIIPQTQLYPYTNPPPGVVLNGPTNNSTYTAGSAVTLSATAMAQYNLLDHVAFYANTNYLGSVSNVPYTLTATGLAAGAYSLTAVAVDSTGLTTTSAPPASITISPGTGNPYGLSARAPAPEFYSMPTSFNGLFPGSIPTLLSQTGVFSDTPAMVPTNGLIPYMPNTPLWSDNAAKTRWMSVPYAGGFETTAEQIGFATNGEWSFPGGTVFVKLFQLATDLTNPNAPLRRLETRLLVRDINGAVYGVTYKWRPDNSEADLLTNSLTEQIQITNSTGVTTQNWYYPSPADCLACHTAAADYVLGVKTGQLNGNFTYPSSGVTDNQLRTLNQLGIFNPSFDEAQIPTYQQLVAVTNVSADLTNRFRSYIDANCSQCHRPGGSGHANFDARYDTPLASQGLINGVVSANLGYDHAYVVAPEDIWRSILYQRINTVNSATQMPPLARNLVDANAVAEIVSFINSLPGTPALAPPTLAPAGGAFHGSVTVTATAGEPVYYTLDGSLPTTNSMLYTGPILLTNSATVSASAFLPGYVNSVAAAGAFIVLPPIFFTSSGMFTNNLFQMQLSGGANQSYILQASTNLTQWLSISTNTPSTTPFLLTDPNAANFPNRFYRVLLQSP